MDEDPKELLQVLRAVANRTKLEPAAQLLRSAADEIDRLRAREAELLAQIESMRSGLDDALDKVRRRL